MDLALKLQEDTDRQKVQVEAALELMEEGAVREKKRRCLGVLVMFCDNLLREPRARGFRRIRLRNPQFQADVATVPGAGACRLAAAAALPHGRRLVVQAG